MAIRCNDPPPVETAVTLKNAGFDVLLCPRDKDIKVIDACLDTVKSENLFGFIHTTWHTLSSGMWLIPLLSLGSFADSAPRSAYSPSLTAYVLRRTFDTNGDYEKGGWSKKQITDMIK